MSLKAARERYPGQEGGKGCVSGRPVVSPGLTPRDRTSEQKPTTDNDTTVHNIPLTPRKSKCRASHALAQAVRPYLAPWRGGRTYPAVSFPTSSSAPWCPVYGGVNVARQPVTKPRSGWSSCAGSSPHICALHGRREWSLCGRTPLAPWAILGVAVAPVPHPAAVLPARNSPPPLSPAEQGRTAHASHHIKISTNPMYTCCKHGE